MTSEKAFKNRSNINVILIYCTLAIKQFFTSPIKLFLGFGAITIILNMWILVHGVDYLIVPSCLCVCIARIAGQLFFLQLKHFRDSGLNKRMRFISNSTFTYLGYVVANFIITTIGIILIILNSLLYKTERDLMPNVNWSLLLLCLLLLWIMFISIDLFFYTFTKNTLYTYCLIISFYIITLYFLGCAYPYYVVQKVPTINTIMYFFPPRYLVNASQASWVNKIDLIFIFEDGEGNSTRIDYGLGNNILYPILISVAFIIFFISAFFIKKAVNRIKLKSSHIVLNSIKNIRNEYVQKINSATTKEQVDAINEEFISILKE